MAAINLKWIKIQVGMFDDEKIKVVEAMPDGDALIVIWLRLLLLAGKINDNGSIYIRKGIPYTPDMLALVFGKKLATMNSALNTFQQLDMIKLAHDGTMSIANWDKNQHVDYKARLQEQTRKRVEKHRKKTKALNQSNVTGNVTKGVTCNAECNADVTESVTLSNNLNKIVEAYKIPEHQLNKAEQQQSNVTGNVTGNDYKNIRNKEERNNIYIDVTLVHSVLKYFCIKPEGFNDLDQHKRSYIFQAIRTLTENGHSESFSCQFEAYVKYKAKTKEIKHRNIPAFMGSPSEKYLDGGWNSRDWSKELGETNTNPASVGVDKQAMINAINQD